MKITPKVLLGLLLVACVAASLSACGRKSMPKPPQFVEPPAINDLMLDNVENDVLFLSWEIPANSDYNLKTFHVYMAQDALATLCLTCPPNFVNVGEGKSITQPDGSRLYTFQMRIQPGFRYIYKINAVGRENIEGPDSNYVVYTYEEFDPGFAE